MNRIIYGIVSFVLASVIYVSAQSAVGQSQATDLRRPARIEFVHFAPTNFQTAPLVWTTAMTRVTGLIVNPYDKATRLPAPGATLTNIVTGAVTGNVVVVSSTINWATNVVVDCLFVE